MDGSSSTSKLSSVRIAGLLPGATGGLSAHTGVMTRSKMLCLLREREELLNATCIPAY